MRPEEIALRQEARQLLTEAGLSKESLKDLVLKDLDAKVTRAVDEKAKEVDLEAVISSRIISAVDRAVKSVVTERVNSYFRDTPLHISASASFEGQECPNIEALIKETYLEVSNMNLTISSDASVKDIQGITASKFRHLLLEKLGRG